MTDMKCPFCQQELEADSQSWALGCSNPNCDSAGTLCGTKELWQELIRTRQALSVATDALQWIDETYCFGLGYESPIKEKIEYALNQINQMIGDK